MKKKILSIVILVTILLLGGCKEKTKTIEFKDEADGYAVTMTVPETSAFEITKYLKNDEGKVNEFTLENKDLNIEADVYFVDSYLGYLKESAENRKDKLNFEEMKYNNYDAYKYSQTESSLALFVLVNETSKKEIVFYMDLDVIDYTKDTNLNDVVKTDEFKEFMNTIEYSK